MAILIQYFLLCIFAVSSISSNNLIFPDTAKFQNSETARPTSPKNYTSLNRPLCAANRGGLKKDGSQSDAEEPCEEDQEYDQTIKEKFDKILVNSALKEIIGDKRLRSLLQDPEPELEFHTRSRFNAPDAPACAARHEVTKPRRGRTSTNEWAFILNHGNMTQSIRTETCIRDGDPCDIGGSIPLPVETYCEQKYVYRSMLTLSNSGEEIEVNLIWIPSCCVCKIRRKSNYVLPRITPVDNDIKVAKPIKSGIKPKTIITSGDTNSNITNNHPLHQNHSTEMEAKTQNLIKFQQPMERLIKKRNRITQNAQNKPIGQNIQKIKPSPPERPTIIFGWK